MKTILVTGSSRGIGKAVAVLAYKQSYKVIIHGKTDSEELQGTHEELKGSIKTFFDVSDKKATQKAIQNLIREVGVIDVLVNNAGIALNFPKNVDDIDDDHALEEYKTNVLGIVHCVQAITPGMIQQKSGSIVNIASIKAHTQLSTMSSVTYGASKAAVISLTKSLAKTYAEHGIRVNSVSPGYIETDQVKLWSPETHNKIKEGTLLGRIGQPEEIASVVMFLASEEASYVTGSDFLADGGFMLKGK